MGLAKHAARVAMLVVASLPSAWAQYSAGLQGIVRDRTGAVVPGAKVSLTASGTEVSQETTSSPTGLYRFTNLAPGNYRLDVTASGFRGYQATVSLLTAQLAEVPVALEVASTQTQVEVVGEVEALETADSRLQTTITEEQLHDLPVAGRDFMGLVAFAPGVTGTGSGRAGSSDNFAVEKRVDASANGRTDGTNLYVLDGLSVTSNIRPGQFNLSPNPDSVQEMSIQTRTYSAEQARQSSVLVSMTTKSGSNQFHGTASYFFADQHLADRGIFDPAKLVPFRKNDFAGTVGGPIWKNRTFFFASVEGLRSLFASPSARYTYPHPDFEVWAKANYPGTLGTKLLTMYPVRGLTPTPAAPMKAKDAFDGNCGPGIVPCDLNAIAYGDGDMPAPRNGNQYSLRIDQYVKSDRIYGNFYLTRVNFPDQRNFRPEFDDIRNDWGNFVQINEVHTFSPTVVNQAYFGLNLPGGQAMPNSPSMYRYPSISINRISGQTAPGPGWGPGKWWQRNFTWRDVLSTMRRSHSLKFGFEAYRGVSAVDFSGVNARPNFNFLTLLDLVQDKVYSQARTAFSPQTGQQTRVTLDDFETTFSAFAQDDWKVRPDLTLNLGLRWDDFGNPNMRRGTVNNFHFGPGATWNERVANGGLQTTKGMLNHRLNRNFSPRAGLAWSPDRAGNWVVRGGFGMYHDWLTLAQGFGGGAESNPPSDYVILDFGGVRPPSWPKPVFNIGNSDEYPYGFRYPATPPIDAAAPGSNIQVIDPDLKSPTSYIFSAGIQRRLRGNLVADVTYTGNRANGILSGSQIDHGAQGRDINRFSGDLVDGKQDRLNRRYAAINYSNGLNIARYDGLIASVKGRFRANSSFQASYTLGKATDYGFNYPNFSRITDYKSVADFDIRHRFSMTAVYFAPRLAARPALVRVPLGGWEVSTTAIAQTGAPFTVFTNAPARLQRDASGKAIGFAPGSGDFNLDGYNYDYPDRPVSDFAGSHSRQDFINGLFKISDFPAPAFNPGGTEGTSGRNSYRNPGFFMVDLGLIKNSRLRWLGDRGNLQFRLETFNLLNRTSLQGVTANLNSPLFGKSTSTFKARNYQLGIRLQF